MTWSLIESSSALDSLLAQHKVSKQVAIDTEFRRRDTFFPKVGLLQLCWDEKAFLIDPLQLDDVGMLRDFLTDSNQLKMIHSASEDLEVFSSWLGILPSPLFDTQRAAGLLGFGVGLGYRRLVGKFFDVDLPKEETQSNWLQRPLSLSQVKYAAQDVSYLYPIGIKLLEQASRQGRLNWILEDSARIVPSGKSPISKFKKAYSLTISQQRVLIAVVDWREQEARRLNRPRGWILSDQLLMRVANICPRSEGELSSIDGIPKAFLRRSGRDLVARVLASLNAIDSDLAEVKFAEPLSREQRVLVATLSDHVRHLAETKEIPSEILMPKAEIEHFVRQYFDPQLPSLDSWAGWREGLVIDPLRAFLAKPKQW